MKKYILIIIAVVFYYTATSQVLYSENFDNLTVGNLGTDPTGVIPGQGGWLTAMYQNGNSNHVTITAEPNRGKALTATSGMPPQQHGISIFKNGLDTLIDQRISGNNVIKLEVDFYTGAQHTFNNPGMYQRIYLLYEEFDPSLPLKDIVSYSYSPAVGGIQIGYDAPLFLPYNEWFTFIVYLDYDNKKIYFETPYFNKVAVGDFLNNSTSTNLIEDFKPTVFLYNFASSGLTSSNEMVNKLDNIKITALKEVPPHVLSAESFLATKFNIYPNPATHVVNITNSENLLVNKVTIYNIAGKQLSTQNFNNEANLQLKVENLASGTYMLHLQTNEGTAVKKIVKK